MAQTAKRTRDKYRFLLVLRNHQPLIALMQSRDDQSDANMRVMATLQGRTSANQKFMGPIRSETSDTFRVGTVDVCLGETDGFEMLPVVGGERVAALPP
jgi:hypothetical protein